MNGGHCPGDNCPYASSIGVGTRIRITDSRFGPGRKGTISSLPSAQSEFYSVRIDDASWPDGLVDLRLNEMELVGANREHLTAWGWTL